MPFPAAPDADWQTAFEAIDAAFAGAVRPEHFTDHTHCCECADEDAFFAGHTPESLLETVRHPETIGIAFLTANAFHYFFPALARMVPRPVPEYSLDTVLFHIENRLDTFTPAQLSAIRDLLYLAYEKMKPEIDASAFDYEAIWRILNQLEGSA